MDKKPWQWDITDVQRLIDQKEPESAYLEYKACDALRNSNGKKKTIDDKKNEMSKDVSAFANAGGGTIIYGVKEKSNVPVAIDDGFGPEEIDKEWLDQVINSRIRRKIEDVRIHEIQVDKAKSDRVIYLINIPQSKRAPHQAGDKKFYTRRNSTSEPMEEYEIRDVFMREETPDVILDMFFRRHGARIERFPLSLVNPETLHGLEINGVLKNEGGGVVQHAVITLYIHGKLISQHTLDRNSNLRPLKIKFEDEEEDVYRMDINWDGASKMPLFKTVEYRLFDEELRINFKHEWLKGTKSPFIMWEVRAPRMEPTKGFLRLMIEDDSALIKQEDVPSEFTITQDGRNRDFLKSPDLSLDGNH